MMISIFEKWTINTSRPVAGFKTGECKILRAKVSTRKSWVPFDQAPKELKKKIAAYTKSTLNETGWYMINNTHRSVFEVKIQREADTSTLPQLIEFKQGDGCHYSIAEPYCLKEEALKKALAGNESFSTGWYGSKKELVSGMVCRSGGIGSTVYVFAQATDDFDTDANAKRQTKSSRWEDVQKVLRETEAQAMLCCETQCPVVLVAVGHKEKGRRKDWISTYLHNPSGLDSVPGNEYSEWGWQDDNLAKGIRDEIEALVREQFGKSRKQVQVSEFIADWS